MEFDKKKYNAPSDDEVYTSESGEAYNKPKDKKWDVMAKILCVLAAFALWLYVMSVDSPTHEKTFTSIPISIRGIPQDSGLSVISGYNNTVDVTLVGKKRDVFALDPDDINAFVDASNVTGAGQVSLPIQLELPGGVAESDKMPAVVRVYFDEKSSVKVPVEVTLTDFSLEEGYQLGELQAEYDEITVTGPAAQLNEISHARVTISGLGRITDSLTSNGTLELVDDEGEVVTSPYLKMQTTSVSVDIPVFVTKTVPIVLEYKNGYFTDENSKVEISPDTVVIRGEPSVLEPVKEILLATIDEKRILDGTTYNYQISFPQGIESVHGLKFVQCIFKLKNVMTRELVVDKFSVNNPNGLEYELGDTQITVSVRGEPSYISYINSAAITAEVDLSRIIDVKGNVSCPVKISFGGYFREHAYELGEYSMMVKIN